VLLALAVAAPSLAFADLNEEQKLGPTATPSVSAGSGVAISDDGTVAVVGSPGEEAAYVYTRAEPGTLWIVAATLHASDGVSGDHFGSSVSISGNHTSANIAVGAPDRNSSSGAVYVYTGSGATWMENPNSPMTAATSAGRLGAAVSIQALRVAAGAPNTTVGGKVGTGVAVVFDALNGGPAPTFRPSGGQARSGAHFGTSISLYGSTVLVGAPMFRTGSKQNSGAVFVFVNNGGSWTQQARLRPSNTANVFYGQAVSLFNNSAAFGAPGDGGKGAVYVFTRAGTTWTQTDKLTAPGGAAGDNFGASVAQLGTFVVAAAPNANSGAGVAYEFGTDGSNYSVLNNLVPSDHPAAALLGFSASVAAGRTIIGAPGDNSGAGAAYVFKFLQPSVATITGTSVQPVPGVASSGVPFTVFVHVDHDISGTGTPTGSVDVVSDQGGTCNIPVLDGSGNGQCAFTSNYFGVIGLTASYGGDLNFSPATSTPAYPLDVTGNHLVFDPEPPADVAEDDHFAGVVRLLNSADQPISSTASVTVTITDTCGNPNILVVPMAAGVATFSGIGPRLESEGQALPTALLVSADAGTEGAPTQSSFNLVTNPDLIFQDGNEGNCLN